MAKRRAEPVITHTEILARSIRSIDGEIESWKRFESVEPDYYEAGTAPLREKREALKALYRIETGTEYD